MLSLMSATSLVSTGPPPPLPLPQSLKTHSPTPFQVTLLPLVLWMFHLGTLVVSLTMRTCMTIGGGVGDWVNPPSPHGPRPLTPIPCPQTHILPLLQRKQPRNPPLFDWRENQCKVKNAEQFRDKPKRIGSVTAVQSYFWRALYVAKI